MLLALLMSVLTAGAQGHISVQAKLVKKQYERRLQRAKTRGETVNMQMRGAFLVTCDPAADALQVAQRLRALDARIVTVKGPVIALSIPVSQLERMAAVEGVATVDAMPKVNVKSDVTRKVTQAAEVNEGTAPKLPQAYTGKGVLLGILDTGFDYTHPMFKDADGNLRIKGVYKPGITDGKDGEKITLRYTDGTKEDLSGLIYSKPDDILDTLKIVDHEDSHATHCLSIAAGSVVNDVKGTSGKPLGGIAPEADLLTVNIYDIDDGFREEYVGYDVQALAILNGLNYLQYQSAKLQEPLVVSMSVNSQFGWHDGTSPMSQLLGIFCEDGDMPLMLSTGNSGGDSTYVKHQIAKGDSVFVGCVPFDDCYVWGGMKTTKKVKMQLSLINWDTKRQLCRIPVTYESDVESDTQDLTGFSINLEESREALDSLSKIAYDSLKAYFDAGTFTIFCYQTQGIDKQRKSYTYTQLYVNLEGLHRIGQDTDADTPQYALLMKLKPEEQTDLHAWMDPYGAIFTIYGNKLTPGSASMSVGDWNTSGLPVSVGAWCANNQIQYEGTPAQDTGDEAGGISWFSSYGTDLAGHKHPDVCAPGSNVVAAINSFETKVEQQAIYQRKGYDNQFVGQKKRRDYLWGTMSGTSMATPAAAGVVALWMQAAMDKGEQLDGEDIKDIIAHASDTDDYTKASPARFGNGKINAYKGLLYVLGLDTAIPSLSSEQPSDVTFRVSGDIVYADGAADGTTVAVYNLQGVLVRETIVTGGMFSLSGLPGGVYAVQLGKLGSTLIRKP